MKRGPGSILGVAKTLIAKLMDLLPHILEKSQLLESVYDIDQNTFEKNYFNKKRPVLLKGFAKQWPAYQKWNLDFFEHLEFKEKVELEIGNVMQKESDFEHQNFQDYIHGLRNPEMDKAKDKSYLSMFEVFEYFPELINDVDFSYLTKNTLDDVPAAWIGPKGTITGFHTDNYNNMLAQIMGRKLVLIAAPAFNKKMYPSKKFDLGSTLSEVDINNYDKAAHPDLLDVEFLKVEMEPGDVLFNPQGWWHYVKSLDTSISVNNFGYTLKDTLFLKPIESLKISLHYRGFYRAKNCTCHKMVDGIRVAK